MNIADQLIADVINGETIANLKVVTVAQPTSIHSIIANSCTRPQQASTMLQRSTFLSGVANWDKQVNDNQAIIKQE